MTGSDLKTQLKKKSLRPERLAADMDVSRGTVETWFRLPKLPLRVVLALSTLDYITTSEVTRDEAPTKTHAIVG